MGMFDFPTQPTPPMGPPREWSDQQRAIFNWFESGQGNLVVTARAGTGKTTTIVEAIKQAPEQRILLAAFNRSIAEELQTRLAGSSAEAATLHSIGLRCVRRWKEGVKPEQKPMRAKILANAVCSDKCPDPVKRAVAKLHTLTREMFPMAKPDDPDDFKRVSDIAIAFDCVPDEEWKSNGYDLDYVAEFAIKAMVLGAESIPSTGIDFADMMFLPVRNRWMSPVYGLVVIDEGQDMSATQLTLAQGVCAPGGRIAVVGDNRQAIYGFRGADSESLARLKRELKATELGLTTTYRCGKAIVADANRIVKDYDAADTAPDGSVTRISIGELHRHVEPGNFVLSRKNAPLVKVAMSLLRANIRTMIRGRDIGKDLKVIVEKLATGAAANSIPQLLKRLEQWKIHQVERADAADMPGKVDFINDQYMTLLAIAEGATGIKELNLRLDTLFGNAGDKGTESFVICSSVHKAKGLESDRVFVLADTLYPPTTCKCGHRHQFGKKECSKCRCEEYNPPESAKREEENIEYVAITRAKSELVWVTGEM